MFEPSDVAQTPCAVALELTRIIANGEGKPLLTVGKAAAGVNKQYVLDLYSECLAAVGSQGMKFSPRS